MVKRLLCVDMDGVLAKWNASAPAEAIYCESSRYFLTCCLQRNLRDSLIDLWNEGFMAVLLTAYLNRQALLDKTAWKNAPVDRTVMIDGIEVRGAGLPMIPIIGVPYGQRKGDFVDEHNAVLLDDFGQNLKAWEGVGVKFLNGINNSHGTRYRYSISADMPAAVIANRLAYIITHGVAEKPVPAE